MGESTEFRARDEGGKSSIKSIAKRLSDDEREQAAWNEEMARRYDPDKYYRESNLLVRWVEKSRLRSIIEFLSNSSDQDLIEIGCGAGNVLEQLEARRKFGIDLSTYMLNKTRERLGAEASFIVQANARALPFPDHSFQRILCTEVIEHVPDPRAVLKEIARLSTPDAVVVITIPNEIWINRVKLLIRTLGLTRLFLKQSPVGENEWHLHDFDLRLIKRLTSRLFEVSDLKAVPWRVLPLRYVLKCKPVAARPET